MTKTKSISIYLHADELKWLDQLCKIWGVGRSVAFQMILRTSKQSSETMLLSLLKNKKLVKDLKEMLRESE